VSALWFHLRTSPLRWLPVPLAALDLAVLLLRPNYWIGIWPETGAAAQVPAFYLSIIAAGSAAWASSAERRHRLGEQLAAGAVAAPRRDAFRLGAATVILVAPYLLGHAIAFALTARTFPPGVGLWAGYLVMGLVALLLATAFGWAMGRLLSPVFAALCALLGWIVIEAVPGSLVDMNVVSGPAWTGVDPLGIAARLAAVLTLWLSILWLRGGGTRRTRLAAAAPAFAAVAVIGVFATTNGVSERPPPDRPLCVEGAIELCLWPEHERYLPMVEEANEAAADLPPVFLLPDRLDEFGLIRAEYLVDGHAFTQVEGDFTISEGNRWAIARAMANAIVNETFASCDWEAIRAEGDYTADALVRWIETELAGGGLPEYRVEGAPEGIVSAYREASDIANALPEKEQHSWAAAQVEHVQGRYCA
jgi:hypothetical protein